MIKKLFYLFLFSSSIFSVKSMDKDDKEHHAIDIHDSSRQKDKRRSRHHNNTQQVHLSSQSQEFFRDLHEGIHGKHMDFLKSQEERSNSRHWQSHLTFGGVASVLIYLAHYFLQK